MIICSNLYSLCLDRINTLPFQEKGGTLQDIQFITNEFWLQDTAVIDHVTLQKGMFCVSLVFSHAGIPMRWLRRAICGYACIKKAELSAHYMRRQAAKDQRGTLNVSIHRYSLNFN
jgi:hypothetical protein